MGVGLFTMLAFQNCRPYNLPTDELSSSATEPIFALSTKHIDFGTRAVGTTSSEQIVIITNSGTSLLTFPSAFELVGDFSFGGVGTCQVGVSYSPGESCTASVTFHPTSTGPKDGSLTISSANPIQTQQVKLAGIGEAQPIMDCTSIVTTVSELVTAASSAVAGAVICVTPGTYNVGTLVSSVSGNATNRIMFFSQTKWAAKIVGSGTGAVWTNSGSYVDIVGFDMSGSGRLGLNNSGSFVSIRGNHVHNLKVSGGCTSSGGAGIVNSNYSASDNEIVGNLVHDIGIPGACLGVQGIYHSNLRGHIVNNIVYRASAWGIHLWHAANAVTIMNNTVFNNGTVSMGGGIVIGSGDSGGGVLDNSLIANNIVYANPSYGLVEYCYSGQMCIGNNVVVSNNLVFASQTRIKLVKGADVATLQTDPLFINFQPDGSGDYHLSQSPRSPAIAYGIPSPSLTSDFEGKARSLSQPSLGAYE